VGGPRAQREKKRLLVEELYEARSRHVHAGRLEADRDHARLLEDSFSLVREILRREIRELPDPPAVTAAADAAGAERPPD
jgi:hypothetical protein